MFADMLIFWYFFFCFFTFKKKNGDVNGAINFGQFKNLLM